MDDVLLMIWDAGITYPKSANSVIRPQDVSHAERACGLATPKEKLNVQYWVTLDGGDREAFLARAADLGIHIGTGARRLPKGALAKLDRAYSPVTGTPSPIAEAAPAEQINREQFVWRDIGHQRDRIQHLASDEIEKIHWAIAEDFRDSSDPIFPAGVRDANLLSSAASRPMTGSGNHTKYGTVELAAGALMHSLVHNHPFYNGNKRTGLVSMLVALDRNGFVITCAQEDLFRWTLRVASHRLNTRRLHGDIHDIEVSEMARWITDNSRSIDRGERVITWSALRRRLIAHGCEIQSTGNRGGRVIVSREVHERRGLLGRSSRLKKYTLPYGGDGRQVGRGHIKELRRELQLSEEHGVDSASFYGTDPLPVDGFISQYRKTLTRLAKM
ncbi:type II toxin-antitoxin system death-on-curing family toxin [Agromyces lapidis]|uniref:Type II toxin-antitoxin system death-on-curing family toxin n=1 Tax=Agromyces lapidis TaxID=279574 RepID=A0ABV5SSH0_9MICO|nr:type II toxin-antitoxin system death-on-curing family toxin [Agromyces lapidis]